MSEQSPEETDQEYSERMHRENNPHYISDDPEFDDDHDPVFDDDYEDYEEACPDCGGTGWVRCNGEIMMECAECGGDGFI